MRSGECVSPVGCLEPLLYYSSAFAPLSPLALDGCAMCGPGVQALVTDLETQAKVHVEVVDELRTQKIALQASTAHIICCCYIIYLKH